ncbi:hypothetical protein EV178_002115 [Coemansia sp. RSA 1646]|nr:hypothetical protein EV178_002115 [Coemansia sp. RSA 1646]
MTWDSFQQRVRYLRGEALSNWPSSITNVVLQPILANNPEECIGVHVWCVGSVPAHGMRRGSLLHCSIPATDNSMMGPMFRAPVAALRSVWMDPDCHAMMDCESLALLRYLQTAAIERLLWHKDTGMVLLADKGRRWIEGRIEHGNLGDPAVSSVRALFTDCPLTDSAAGGELSDAAELLRENDWYYERGGADGRFIAFSRSSNVVVYDTATRKETQVTWATDDGVQYGAVDVSMEEELGRTTGIFWEEPAGSDDSVVRMLCSRVDERGVMTVGLPELPASSLTNKNKVDLSANTIGAPATLFADKRYGWDTGCAYGAWEDKNAIGYLTDFQKYSRPGTPGPITDWVIVEIEHTGSDGIVRHRVRPLYERFRLATLFPWCEYVVRAGWMPKCGASGSAIWLQLLDRAQKRTAIVRVPLGCFGPGVDEPYDPLDESLFCDIINRTTHPPAPNAHIDVLYEEARPEAWINLNSALRFLSDSPTHNTVRFILASERTGGFSHLHLVTAHITPPRNASYVWQAQQHIVPLTEGKWPVTDDAPVFVDEKRKLVCFSARRPNPLTTNLYATSYQSAIAGGDHYSVDPLWQLTCNGYTHSHFVFDPTGTFFYCQSSNLTTPVRHCIYMIHDRSAPPPPDFHLNSSSLSAIRSDLRRSHLRMSSSRLPTDSIGSLYGDEEEDYLMAGTTPDDCLSDTMSFYSASCEPQPKQYNELSARCVCVMEISSAPLLRSHPLISPDPMGAGGAAPGIRRMGSIRKPACRLSVCSSSSSSVISLSSQSQSVDSIASDEMFVERLLSKLRTSGQSIQHSTLASDLMKLKRLTPAYVSQRVTKAVRSALPFCSTPTIIPRHLLHSSLLQPLTGRTLKAAASASTPVVVGKETLATRPPQHFIDHHHHHKKVPVDVDASQKSKDHPPTGHDCLAHCFVSSLTTASRPFVARESLLGIDDPGHRTSKQLPVVQGDPVPKLFCVPVPRHCRSAKDGSEPNAEQYELVFGHVYLPPDFRLGEQYPTVVNAYGGPQCQLVTNAYPYPRHRRLAMLTRMSPANRSTVLEFSVPQNEDANGAVDSQRKNSATRGRAMVVVCLDGRGTPHRGLGFESAIRGQLGCLEVDDIVCALEYLCTYGLSCLEPVQSKPPIWCQHTMSATIAEKETGWTGFWRPPVFAPPSCKASAKAEEDRWDLFSSYGTLPRLFIDRTSVAIHGWSYGGYVALRALAQYPQWFRVAVAGAPVVRWEWYSSAYIERYLGTLDTDSQQKAYEDASLVSVADQLLSSDRGKHGRILVVHGWNDDNVHVAHTAALVRELCSRDAEAAPQLCVYANERHGLRLPSSNEHFETMLSFWLFHLLQQEKEPSF